MLVGARLRAGVWEARVEPRSLSAAADVPALVVTLQGVEVQGVDLRPLRGAWGLRVPVEPRQLWDGVQTWVVRERATGARVGSFALMAGVALEEDLRAEIDLLRAELDLLRRAFRRHCAETDGLPPA